jgi:DNA-directed RNA polymerases I and III subunit RPAC2
MCSDHTLGNVLRHIIMRQPETDFCGYSVPHPYEPKMNVRIQTHEKPAVDVMVKSLQDLGKVCDMLETEFDRALDSYATRSGQ